MRTVKLLGAEGLLLNPSSYSYWDLNSDMPSSNLFLLQLPGPSLGNVVCVLQAKALHAQSYNGLSRTMLAKEGFRYSTTMFGTETNKLIIIIKKSPGLGK